ncbi:MAG: acyl-CoA thioesterase [Lentisphaeraceae bacterium]|nr:acyl-CoA thioesterase [Lentisphaeraceae bacterium]
MIQTETEVEVQFHDVDSMNVVWHGHYVKYFEMGRNTLLRKLGYDYPQMAEHGYAWPVVDCKARYVSPALYGMVLTVTSTMKEYENRLVIDYMIRDGRGKKICKGSTTQVAVQYKNERKMEMDFVTPKHFQDLVKKHL